MRSLGHSVSRGSECRVRESKAYVCTCFRQSACDFVADASSAAGNYDGFAVEAEHLEDAVLQRRVGAAYGLFGGAIAVGRAVTV